jgi:F-type H+-transporting ATPase subunit delta
MSTSIRWPRGKVAVATNTELIRAYAGALFSVAKAEGVLGAVEDQLYEFGKALESNTPLRQALTDAALPVENKGWVIRDLLGDRANPLTVSLLNMTVGAGRAREIPAIVEELAAMAAGERQHVLAEVRTAIELSASQRERIVDALSRATGKEVDVKVIVDPSVVGGAVTHVGDLVLDGTVRSRLADAKRYLS